MKRIKFRIKSKIFLLDATTISLCLSLFDWARYKTKKGTVKIHTLLDYDGHLPAYVNITYSKTADNKGAYDIPLLKGSVIEVITNQISWTANTITELYKARREVEIFFRDIKQQLHIKSFIGTSENAVMIQIWTALITILILKALKTQAKHPWYISNLVVFIRLNLFVKVDLHKWFYNPFAKEQSPPNKHIQEVIF
jgi:hypothetical protein